MRELPSYSLENFFYEKTNLIETTAYGIESRFWYAGKEIPDLKELDPLNTRPDKTPIEELLQNLKIPVSEYVVQSYVRDSLFQQHNDIEHVMTRLIPSGVNWEGHNISILVEYVSNILEEFRDYVSPFSDKGMGPIRQRAAELHTAIIDLAARLTKGDIELSWLPKHTFIILSQIQNHTANVLEEMNLNEPPPEAEMETLENSLDGMIETYEEMKELIDEALNSFRLNNFALIRPGNKTDTITEWLIQISIGGIDVWRRIIVNEHHKLSELHRIIQTAFGWRDSQAFRFSAETGQNKGAQTEISDGETSMEMLEAGNITELLYEYGTKWAVRVMLLSKNDSPASKPVRCVAGAGAAPPEFMEGPLKFKRALSALENGNDMERLGARQELGPEFMPGEFDINACNRNLARNFPQNGL